MHFDVCSVLTSNQKQLQLEVEQNDPMCESVCMPLRCLLMNIEGQNIEKIKLQCTDTHKNGFYSTNITKEGFYTNTQD